MNEHLRISPKLSAILALVAFVFPAVCGVMIGGLATAWLYVPIIGAPAGLILLFQRRHEASVAAAVAIIVIGSIGLLLDYLGAPLRTPLLEGWFASTCGAVAVQGVGQYVVGADSTKPLRPVVVALILTLSVTVQSAIAVSAVLDLKYPSEQASLGIVAASLGVVAVLGALMIGLPFLLVNALFGRADSTARRLGYVAGIGIVGFLYLVYFVVLLNPPGALVSEVHVSANHVQLAFDSARNSFVAQEWISADFEWRDDRDVVRAKDGPIEPWNKQAEMQETIGRVGLSDFSVVTASLVEGEAKSRDATIRINLNLRRDTLLKARKTGLLFYNCEIRIPPAVVFSRGPKAEIEIQVLVPDHFGLKHNLDAEPREIVLPNGEQGLGLRASTVQDLWGVIRLKYPIALLRNPILASVAAFNGWTLVLALQALICGVIGFWFATAADIIKDRRFKPAAERLLARVGLICNVSEEESGHRRRRGRRPDETKR